MVLRRECDDWVQVTELMPLADARLFVAQQRRQHNLLEHYIVVTVEEL